MINDRRHMFRVFCLLGAVCTHMSFAHAMSVDNFSNQARHLDVATLYSDDTPSYLTPSYIVTSHQDLMEAARSDLEKSTYVRVALRKISSSEAKSIVKRQHPNAKVVDVSREGDTYKVRLLRKNGRVIDVYVDRNTGRVRR